MRVCVRAWVSDYRAVKFFNSCCDLSLSPPLWVCSCESVFICEIQMLWCEQAIAYDSVILVWKSFRIFSENTNKNHFIRAHTKVKSSQVEQNMNASDKCKRPKRHACVCNRIALAQSHTSRERERGVAHLYYHLNFTHTHRCVNIPKFVVERKF